MKANTPEGVREVKALEFSLEEPERALKVILADGTTLLWRPTLGAVFSYESSDGTTQYIVSMNSMVVKIE